MHEVLCLVTAEACRTQTERQMDRRKSDLTTLTKTVSSSRSDAFPLNSIQFDALTVVMGLGLMPNDL